MWMDLDGCGLVWMDAMDVNAKVRGLWKGVGWKGAEVVGVQEMVGKCKWCGKCGMMERLRQRR
jgi:hypothetical protein